MGIHNAASVHQSREPINAADRLIVALDFDDVETANTLVSQLGETVSCYKVGYYLQLISGYDRLVDRLIDGGKRVLLDTKICDISETVRAAVTGAVRRRASFLTIHGNGDVSDAALKAAVEAKEGSQLQLLLVTVLTSLDDLDMHAIGYRSVMEEAKVRASRALQFALDGVICSGFEAKEIRNLATDKGFTIATPGIRPTGMPREDQKRVMTPAAAIANSADYLIVGRPIIRAANPMQAAKSIIQEMQTAFDIL